MMLPAPSPPVVRARPRGFVLLIVLALITVLTVLVATQLDLLRQQASVGLQSDETARARGIAEGCLAFMEEYANGVVRGEGFGMTSDDEDGAVTMSAYGDRDFDKVLEPDASHRYVPPYGDAVHVPGGATDSRHRFQLLRLNEGGCLVRFDDNSDDAIPATQLGYFLADDGNADEDSPDEGPGPANKGRDNSFKDRDGAIVMTAIGLYPVRPETSSPSAYEAAHARVTLRRVLSLKREGYEGAIISGGKVTIKGDARVCGYGGVQSPRLALEGDGCSCGVLDVESGVSGNTARGACACGAASCAQTMVRDPPGPAPTYNPADLELWWQRSTFRVTDSAQEEGQCSVHMTTGGRVFLWDRFDTDAKDQSVYGYTVECKNGALCEDPGPHNCREYPYRPSGEVENPCAWTPSGKIVCDGEETPCWKLIADLSPGGYSDGAGGYFDPAKGNTEWDDDGSERMISFRRGVHIPNTKGNRMLGVDSTGPNPRMCGEIGSCTDCNGKNAAFEYVDDTLWRTVSQSSDRTLPTPAMFLIMTNNGRVDLKDVGGESNLPTRVSFAVRGDLNLQGKSGICGFRSKECHKFPIDECIKMTSDNTDQKFPFHVDWRTADHNVVDEEMMYSIAIQATGQCVISSDGVLGGVQCGSVEVKSDACIYGDVMTMLGKYTGGGTKVDCPCAPNKPNSICFTKGRPLVVGLVQGPGDVCGNSAARLELGVIAGGKVRLGGAMKSLDWIEAWQGVTLSDDAIVTFSESTAGAFAARKVRTFQEAPW